jgi:membrane fusion protein (multidrug efflux system)
LALVVALTGCKKEEERAAPPPEVLVAEVTKRDVPVYGEWVGTLEGFINAQIRAKVQGYLLKTAYQEGTLVKEGDVLFQLDPRQYEAALAQAKANLSQAQAILVRSQQNVTRYRPLVANGAVSKKELDDMVQTAAANAANVDAARAAIDNAKLELDWTTIRSPITGIAGIAKAQVGDLVAPSTLMTTISQVDPIKVYFPVSEQEYLRFAARNPGATDGSQPERRPSLQLILADGTVYDQPGKVTAINREVEVQTGSLQIQAAFPNPANRLRPGGYAKVRALVDDRKNALVVPPRAVQEVQGKHQVVVVGKDDVAEIRPVTVGPKTGDFWVIDKGLEAGDRVVVEGLQKARNGTKVAPKPFVPAQ